MDPDERPSALSSERVRQVAHLARLRLSPDDLAELPEQLHAILDHFAVLENLDLDDITPMSHPLDVTGGLADDDLLPSLDAEVALGNVPARAGDFIAVPRVIGGGGEA